MAIWKGLALVQIQLQLLRLVLAHPPRQVLDPIERHMIGADQGAPRLCLRLDIIGHARCCGHDHAVRRQTFDVELDGVAQFLINDFDRRTSSNTTWQIRHIG